MGGISANTTEQDLLELFSQYGIVKATKIISDRAGVSKGYGFVTFETEEEARRLTQEVTICLMMKMVLLFYKYNKTFRIHSDVCKM